MIYLMPNYFDFEQYQVGRYYFINLYVKKPVRDNRPQRNIIEMMSRTLFNSLPECHIPDTLHIRATDTNL